MADELQLDLEQEEIRTRIDESRDALVQKIEKLEEKVTDTVESATASVAEATEAVMETVQNATASVSETVDSVTGAMQGTVNTVRDSVEGAVDAVKDAFDVSRMVQEYPWMMLAGSVGVGYLAGQLFSSFTNGASPAPPSYRPQMYGASFDSDRREPSYPGTTMGGAANGTTFASPPVSSTSTAPRPQVPQATVFDSIKEALQPEVSKLSGLAIGAGFGSLKYFLLKNVPPALQQPLSSVIDDVTKRLGGECVQGSFFTEDGR